MKTIAFLALIATLFIAATADAARHKDWNGWSFDYDVYGADGLELRSVTRNGRSVLFNASFPTMRVDYAPGRCNDSPFSDLLHTGNLLPRSWNERPVFAPLDVHANWCGDKLCAREYEVEGHMWLEIGITANEGNYIIYQAWYLSDHGHLLARVYSKGEQCPNATHRHHPYWRFDFDVNQAGSNSVFVHDDDPQGTAPPDKGWGPGVDLYRKETDETKSAPRNRVWFVQDDLTKDAVWLLPGRINRRDDGPADLFSNRDLSALVYHEEETGGPWPTHSDGRYELGYTNGEDLASQDVVLWYVAHFQHDEPLGHFDSNKPCGDPEFPPVFNLPAEGGNCNDVFGAGPELIVVNSPGDVTPLPPFDFSVKIRTTGDDCGQNAVLPKVVTFWSEVTSVPFGDSPTYSWTIQGSDAVPIGRANEQNLQVKLGESAAHVEIVLTVTLLGVTRSASYSYVADTPQTARMKQFRCRVISNSRFKSQIEPLGDPARDLAAHPYTREELLQLAEFGRQVLEGASGLLNSTTPIR